ncbi:predicted protein [Histoplasma capsulatum var. duboisii H88]|uniref:Predicted protein n=2 Tax=Ajellomyces capsulatus TaxID=5037 RepID=F0UQN9_AJEC8|nr:predicted protein [Histoplasma capsulatum H143]EGC48216.1 predicted protein [Histoplasma capsulatum var. duboisii H88]
MDDLKVQAGTSFDGFAAPGNVIETGRAESWPHLNAAKGLWLEGGGGAVQLVLLIKWTKTKGNRIEGELQVHGRGPASNIVLLQTEVGSTVLYILHTNNSGCDTRSIPIAGGQLFGSRVFNGRNPHDIYNLSVSNVPTKAAGSIGAMGFVPT